MKTKQTIIHALLMLLLSFSLSVQGQEKAYPAPVQNLLQRGVEVVAEFDAPGGLKGYAAEASGRPLVLYVTGDNKHVIVGQMLDSQGNNLSDEKVQQLITAPKSKKAWPQLEASSWVLDGDKNAPVIVYTFTDPNCPYCYRFREQAEPWIKAGKVQLRHVVVGILREDSVSKAATILGAKDSSQYLQKHHDAFKNGGITPEQALMAKGREKLAANNQLMRDLGLTATPTTFYKTAQGAVTMAQGLPSPEAMVNVMGSKAP